MRSEEPNTDWVVTSKTLPESSQPVLFQVEDRILDGSFVGGLFRAKGGGQFAPEKVRRWKPALVLPDILYKYRDLNRDRNGDGDSNFERVRQILIENKIWFSSPADFNDPFDCRMSPSAHIGAGRLKRYLREKVKERGLSRKAQLAESRRVVQVEKRHQDPSVFENIVHDLQQHVNGLGVLCLSTRKDELLMWSYYGGGHTGVCLGFLHGVGVFSPAMDVTYSPTYPDFHLLDESRRTMELALLTKAEAWRHEGEWRVIDHDQGRGLRVFAPELLSEVILGAKMSPQDRAAVVGWIAEGRCRPALYEARLKKNEYGLDIVPVPA